MQAVMAVAAMPYSKMAQAEADLAASMAKGTFSKPLDSRWSQLITTMCRLQSKEGEAIEPAAEQARAHRSEFALLSIQRGLDHFHSTAPFGSSLAAELARDLCASAQRWTVDAVGAGRASLSDRAMREAGFIVHSSGPSSGANVRISCPIDDQTDLPARAAPFYFSKRAPPPARPCRALFKELSGHLGLINESR